METQNNYTVQCFQIQQTRTTAKCKEQQEAQTEVPFHEQTMNSAMMMMQ